MIKLAITGNIASGKSLIESFLQEEGILVIDTDKIVHELLSHDKEIIEKVYNLFDVDVDVKDKEGKIDRKKVADIVFNDKNKLDKLEKILHPEVKKLVDKFFEENKDEKILAVSVPQLYETGWEVYFDCVLLVVADDKTRLLRLMNRNNLSEEESKSRLKAQILQEEKAKKADFIVENSGNIENTKTQVKEILEKLKK